MSRYRYNITGIVQGVGFRPFVYRLASEEGLSGWVRNVPAGVELEVQGPLNALERFGLRLTGELPPLAEIVQLTQTVQSEQPDEVAFTILASSDGRREVQIAPDTALCPDCRRELFDPDDRRFQHPFITCTNCGPRYTIVTGIPYDRPLTTMAGFPLCHACQAEYDNPADRRFHAQPIACPECGPRLALIPDDPQPLQRAAALLQQLDCGRLRWGVAAHLSAQNNRRELACAALSAVLGCGPDEVGVADQEDGFDWRIV
jgi:hydrogenase maturation protein HypF